MSPQQPADLESAAEREPNAARAPVETSECPRCAKPAALCVCDDIAPIDNKVGLLVLQHPQEQDRLLGTARLATLHLTNSVFKIGLSWPSLAKALGRPADPSQWAILHLGSAKSGDLPGDRELVVLDKKGVALPDQDQALAGLRGVVIFDGTWAQAKTLWWRNAWVLKARRLVLNPRRASLYGQLRREPRREGLSTIEAAALALSRIERRPDLETALRASFARMLERYRAAKAEGLLDDGGATEGAPQNKKKRLHVRPKRT
ncbi:MAG: tRNA-uridine aminocarboxypropyltransferase [Methylocystis sp.]